MIIEEDGEVFLRNKTTTSLGEQACWPCSGHDPSNQLAAHVHNTLVETAALTCKAVEAFGAAVESVLIKHGEYR